MFQHLTSSGTNGVEPPFPVNLPGPQVWSPCLPFFAPFPVLPTQPTTSVELPALHLRMIVDSIAPGTFSSSEVVPQPGSPER